MTAVILLSKKTVISATVRTPREFEQKAGGSVRAIQKKCSFAAPNSESAQTHQQPQVIGIPTFKQNWLTFRVQNLRFNRLMGQSNLDWRHNEMVLLDAKSQFVSDDRTTLNLDKQQTTFS